MDRREQAHIAQPQGVGVGVRDIARRHQQFDIGMGIVDEVAEGTEYRMARCSRFVETVQEQGRPSLVERILHPRAQVGPLGGGDTCCGDIEDRFTHRALLRKQKGDLVDRYRDRQRTISCLGERSRNDADSGRFAGAGQTGEQHAASPAENCDERVTVLTIGATIG